MDLLQFIEKRPYLYHLTNVTNLELIMESKILLSTKEIVDLTLQKKERNEFLRTKRDNHFLLESKNATYTIRDQQPILLKVLERSLSDGLDAGDFIELLNKRVFWWPTLNRLNRHFTRYITEGPVILRVKSSEMFELNKNIELCHLNSGATRCHPKYGGNAPTRGKDSFLKPAQYDKDVASVAEVTFLGKCELPEKVWFSKDPEGPWKLANDV